MARPLSLDLRLEAVAALDSAIAWRTVARPADAAVTSADIALATTWLRRFDLNLRAPVATLDLGMEAAPARSAWRWRPAETRASSLRAQQARILPG